MVNHHTRKNGFKPLSNIPIINGPCFEEYSFDDFFNNPLSCNPVNANKLTAPRIDMYSLKCGNVDNEIAPIPKRMTNGNSTTVWPYAILIPDIQPPFTPYATFAVKRGPGDITPETEMVMTVMANSSMDTIT